MKDKDVLLRGEEGREKGEGGIGKGNGGIGKGEERREKG